MSNKKVRMLVNISGTRDGEDWPKAGEFITLPKAEAEDLIRQGAAAEPKAAEENALADVLGVETAVATAQAGTAEGQQSIRQQMKPAPHADEQDAYHVPALPGEQAAAEAGQKNVDEANQDTTATTSTPTEGTPSKPSPRGARGKATDKAGDK